MAYDYSEPLAVSEIESSEPYAAYMWPDVVGRGRQSPKAEDLFVFQYWPQTLEDTYTPEYSQKQIPGGSHPLYQWVGGSGRDITFQAIFTAEVADPIVRSTGASILGFRVNPAKYVKNAFEKNVQDTIPSRRFTVDVAAAISRLRSFLLPSYEGGPGSINGLTSPPKKLNLVLQGTKLGGERDHIRVLLRSAPFTYESWFPDGTPRIATVSLTFSEIVQHTSAEGSKIKFIGRSSFEKAGRAYKYTSGNVHRPLLR